MAPDSLEGMTIERLVSTWTHFAKTGDPNNAALESVEWTPVGSADKVILRGINFDEEVTLLEEFPEVPRIAFWNNLLKLKL